ncbi:MAG: sensor histidine kinase [Actinomycetota bacterium]|nr:sensor histidine kinase [Actinomycetota bacterium]MDP9484662.1 sensor histidine kinase [Actinomycetota bacterium]
MSGGAEKADGITQGGGPGSPGLSRAARVLEERTGEILADYVGRLEEIGSLLVVGGGNTPEQLEAQARGVLARASSVLRGEERSLLAVEEEIYRNIEDSEEPLNPHPDESFRAGVALCKAAVSVVVDDLTPETSPAEVAEVALAVQEIVMDRISRMVMASFVDYLLTKVKETQNEERRRFSRELHDRLAHEMTVVSQSLDLHGSLRERDPGRAEERLDLARRSARGALELMREFSHELRETETSDGLRIALQNLMRISVPSGVESEVVFEGEEEHLPDYVRDQLYMVLREGVRNAVAHSGSESIVVEVNISPREVVALVWDHGEGFETSEAVSEGVGLSSMRERAELLGGSFEVASKGERGTAIKVRLPLMREKGR